MSATAAAIDLSCANSVVADAGELVFRAIASINVQPQSPGRCTAGVVLVAASPFGAEEMHDAFPLNAMRADQGAVEGPCHDMGNLVWHRLGQKGLAVFRQQQAIVTDERVA